MPIGTGTAERHANTEKKFAAGDPSRSQQRPPQKTEDVGFRRGANKKLQTPILLKYLYKLISLQSNAVFEWSLRDHRRLKSNSCVGTASPAHRGVKRRSPSGSRPFRQFFEVTRHPLTVSGRSKFR